MALDICTSGIWNLQPVAITGCPWLPYGCHMLPSQDQQISLLGRLRRVVSSEVKSRSGRWAMWITVRSLLAISTIALFDTFWIYHHLPSLTPPVPTSVTGTRLTTYSLLRCLLALLFCSRAVEDRIANVRIVDVDLQTVRPAHHSIGKMGGTCRSNWKKSTKVGAKCLLKLTHCWTVVALMSNASGVASFLSGTVKSKSCSSVKL